MGCSVKSFWTILPQDILAQTKLILKQLGQHRRCYVVCLQVLLLDELTTFLDSTDQESVLRAVRGIVDAQGTDPVTALWVGAFLLISTSQLTVPQTLQLNLCVALRSLASYGRTLDFFLAILQSSVS